MKKSVRLKQQSTYLKPRIIYLVKYLCCKTEHKTQLSFSQRQKILKCLWSENFELQKCGHTGKSNYGLNLPIILMFLTIYGVKKRSVTQHILQNHLPEPIPAQFFHLHELVPLLTHDE